MLIASGQQFCALETDWPNVCIPFTARLATLEEGMRHLVEAWRTCDRQPVAADEI